MRENTSPKPDDDELEEYYDDADEVLDALPNEAYDEDSDQSMDEELDEEDGVMSTTAEQPERDDAKVTFRKHTGSVFCCALHPTADLAASGGEDDKAYVWNTETGEVQHEVTNHSDSVIGVGFSHDGTFLASGDMMGYIQVFKVRQNYRKVWEFTIGDMCWMQWHTVANVLLAGSEAGDVYVWRIPSGDCKILQGHGSSCDVAELTPDGKKIAVGYGDGHFKLWDLKTGSKVMEVSPGVGHSANITAMAVAQDNQLFITGDEDGKVYVMGPTGVLGMLANSSKECIESVLVDNPNFEIKIAATGTLEGELAIWDVSRMAKRVDCSDENPSGITRMHWVKDHILCAARIDGLIKGWDVRSGMMRFTLSGHLETVLCLAYDQEKNIILSGSQDSTVKIFEIPTSV